MADTGGAPAPKKRSLFKRAAWQDAAKQEDEDMFSHANEFQDIVTEQNRRREEDKRSEAEARQRKQAEQCQRKRRKVSVENDEPTQPRSTTPLSPRPPPDSLAARYDSLTKPASSNDSASRKESTIILLDDDDDDETDDAYGSQSCNRNPLLDAAPWNGHGKHAMPVDDEDEFDELLDPALAALKAKARERAAQKAQSAVPPAADGQAPKAPVAQLLISPEIPNTLPLMVKVRINSTIEKPRLAWCGKQGFSSDMTKSVFFTWRGTRIYDSTTIKRLGFRVDADGNVSVDGDSNVYDDVNLPKVYVEAWTDELFQQRKKEEAAEAAAKMRATEAPPVVEEREPTPEPAPKATKIRLVMKAKGKQEYYIAVNSDTTFGHLATAYKTAHKIDKSQPITLTFDGDRLPPMDTIADTEIEDLDSVEVLFK